MTGQRIVIVGTSGSGKTTLASQVAARLLIPHIELDRLNWLANWQQAPQALMEERVDAAILQTNWVLDGNYSRVRDRVWRRATMLIWLDYSFALTMYRITRRSIKRVVTQEPLWGTENRESWQNIFSKSGMIHWAATTYWRRKREYPALLAAPAYAHLEVLRFKRPSETQRWLARLG